MAFVRIPGNEIPEGAEEHWLEGRGGVKVRVLTAPAFAVENVSEQDAIWSTDPVKDPPPRGKAGG